MKVLAGCTENPNAPDCDNGITPIHLAAEYGHFEIVKTLLDYTKTPNVPENKGWTPIHYAAQNGHTKIVKKLLRYSENPNTPDNHGITPANLASKNGYIEIVNALVPGRGSFRS